jgi:hypothetical protein
VDLTLKSIWVGSTCAYEPTARVVDTETREHEVLYSDSICTDGLRFNDGLIRGRLAFVGKRQPWPYLCWPKGGRAVAGKDLVLRNASQQQRGHRRVTRLGRERGPQQMLGADRVVAHCNRHVSGSQHERSRSVSESFEHGSPVHEALQRGKLSMAADEPSTRYQQFKFPSK